MTDFEFNQVIYPKLWEFLLCELSSDCSGHNHQHASRVVKNAKEIMNSEGGNYIIVVTAALLHDIIDSKLFDDTAAQLRKVDEKLVELSFSDSMRTEILYIIQNISFSGGKSHDLHGINAQIVCDADRLDALGAVGIVRTIEYGASRGRQFYSDENLSSGEGGFQFGVSTNTSLSHFYDKLLLLEQLMYTSKGRELAKERSCFMQLFLKQFYSEI